LQLLLFPSGQTGIGSDVDERLVTLERSLSGLIPDEALPVILWWFSSNRVELKLSPGRKTKLGDFRPSHKGSLPVISVNRNLNPYAFLITLVHEMAHFQVLVNQPKPRLFRRQRRVPPHGKIWKEEFRTLINPLLNESCFPESVLTALTAHMRQPKAATFSDPVLAKALMVYDQTTSGVLLESLPEGTIFSVSTGTLFRKGVRRRIRFRCIRQDNNRIYLFSPLAMVYPVRETN